MLSLKKSIKFLYNKYIYVDYTRRKMLCNNHIKNILDNKLFSPRPENFEYTTIVSIPYWGLDTNYNNTWHLHNHSLEWLLPFISDKKFTFFITNKW